ncbi:MAG: 16S rRNA (adenine(1518)-N(6)/adenine(1519)-N(6))-dimethyltransferase RsmA [Candidatus Aenigmatarchaeota archaeon]
MDVKKTLRKYSVEPKEYEDQFFIADEKLQKKIVNFADLEEDDKVLEIGAGIGNLTEHIVKECKVTAIERDGELAAVLRHQELPNLTVLQRDVMATRLENLDFNKIITNFPYSISTPLTIKLLDLDWELAVLVYQKEFAERVAGEVGTMNNSRLSLKVRHHTEPEILKEIPSEKIYPEPATDSAVVRLERKDAKAKSDRFWKIVNAAFHHKRKLVKNSLKDSAQFLGLEEEEIKEVEEELPDKRVYQCGVGDFEKIEEIIEEIL